MNQNLILSKSRWIDYCPPYYKILVQIKGYEKSNKNKSVTLNMFPFKKISFAR